MDNEAQARIRINKLLEEVGWRFFDNESCRCGQYIVENHIKIKEQHVDALGTLKRRSKSGLEHASR